MRVLKESCKKYAQIVAIRPQHSYVKNGVNYSQASLLTSHRPDPQTSCFNWIIPQDGASQSYLSGISDIIDNYFIKYLRKSEEPCAGQTRKIHLDSKKNFNQKTPRESSKPLPRLLYVQNPLVWISNKLDFRFLRIKWDPLFNETEFTRGARQAVSTVTYLVSKNMFETLKPLLTKNALLNLRRDVEITWADEVRRNIALKPEDVQLIIPRKLHFRNSGEPKLLERGFSSTPQAIVAPKNPKHDKKFCDIDVLFIGLKWLEEQKFNQTPLVFVDIVARFHRNYTEGISPDWTISAFKVRRFNLIPQKN